MEDILKKKSEYIQALKKDIFRIFRNEDYMTFKDEGDLFHFLYKRYRDIFDFIYLTKYESLSDDYEWTFEGLKKDEEFYKNWKEITNYLVV